MEVEQTTETDEGSLSEARGPPLYLPCQTFCEELSGACGDRIPKRLWSKIDCTSYPENGTCIPKPGCVAELSGRSLGHLLCDGLPDCEDRADETLEQCGEMCSSKQEVFHCDEGSEGNHVRCIEKYKRCDGMEDCSRGGDEKGCIYLESDKSEMSAGPAEVMMIHRGQLYSICGDEDSTTMGQNSSNEEIASWVCNKLNQGEVKSLKLSSSTKKHFLRPTAGISSFMPTSCPSGRTLHLKCHRRECGLNHGMDKEDDQAAMRVALPGDWPWQAVLTKDGHHVCDATLVSAHWILTAALCFEGFVPPTMSWMVRLGALRPTGSQHPWLQETSLVGMVTSPTGFLALGRLTNPIKSDGYIGAACLPELISQSHEGHHTSLTWGNKGDRLESVSLHSIPCSNVSSEASNLICMEGINNNGSQSCSGMQIPGTPLLYRNPNTNESKQSTPRWILLGLDAGRKEGSESIPCRGLVFEAVRGSLDWIRHTIEGISQTGDVSTGGRR